VHRKKIAAPITVCFSRHGIEQYLSGVILFDETLRQKSHEGVRSATTWRRKGIIPGIKVDGGGRTCRSARRKK